MSNFSSDANMRKMGFIYETVEPTSEAMADIPKNRTILAADLTDKPATRPEMTYELETIDDVFEHFEPSAKIEFNNAEGASVNEELHFSNLGDFGAKSMIKQSGFLNLLNDQNTNYSSFSKRLQNNKVLQKVLNDPDKKAAYVTVLRSMLQELENNGD